jgi:hypothetical protein
MYVQRVTAFAGPLAGGAPGVQTDWGIYTVKDATSERCELDRQRIRRGKPSQTPVAVVGTFLATAVTVVRQTDAE